MRALLLHDVTRRVAAHARLEKLTLEMEAQAEERGRLLEERDRALADLQGAMRQRSRFYASMSHELRTPINAIIGYNDLLLGGIFGALADEHREPLERVSRAAAHLLELVNDILDLSKIEAGKIMLEPEMVSVPELVNDLTATVEPLARANGVELRFDVHRTCDPPLRTDPRRLRQVLMNLLSNAIRYGRGRPVEVTCRVVEGALETRVKDRGPGVPEDKVESIFEEFVQLESAEGGGTGLGLSIARTLALSLGGTLTVASRPGGGSTFTLRVPSMEEA